MASNVKVVGTDLRQITIKVNPGTRLTEVLEQACEKLKVSPTRFQLKHKTKLVDLSNTYRTSGLVPGAKLELVARSNTPTAINVALQLPPPEGGRLTKKLPTDFTLWKVLRQFESDRDSQGKVRNFTERGVPPAATASGSGQLYYETPVIQLGNDRDTLSTFADFQKTLSQLGYNTGNVLIRLTFRATDRTFHDATSEIDRYFKEEEKAEASENTSAAPSAQIEDKAEASQIVLPSETPSAPTVTTNAAGPEEAAPSSTIAASEVDTPMADPVEYSAPQMQEILSQQQASEELVPSAEARPIKLYQAPSSGKPAAADANDSDEAFVPGIEQAKAHQSLLKHLGGNKKLLSDRELEEKAAAQREALAKTQRILIRVRHPDNTMFEREYSQDDTGSVLYADVRSQMANPALAFRLVAPPRELIRDDSKHPSSKLITGYKLRSNTLVNFVWDDSIPDAVRRQPFLKEGAASKMQQVQIPEIPESRPKAEQDSNPVAAAASSAMHKLNNLTGGGGGAGVKTPKWLKGFGKK